VSEKVKKRKYRFLRRIVRVLLGILVFLCLVVLFIRSPWGQGIIVEKATSYVSDKTNTKVEIKRLFLTFTGGLQIDSLYLEDKKGDTLIYSNSLEATIPLWATITGKSIGVDNLRWNGLRANIIRKDTISGYNFQFLIDAFASNTTTETVQDTTTTSPNISTGDVNLKDIDVIFNDDVIGINSRYKIGELDVEMESIDLEKMIFKADEILISDSDINFVQKPIATESSTEKSSLPFLSANSITINNVNAYYESQENKILANVKIGRFYTEIPEINLANNSFKLNTIQLKNSDILFKTSLSTTVSTSEEKVKETTSSEIIWPNLIVAVDEIDFENNNINYFVDDAKVQQNRFNPNVIALEKLTLKASDIFLKDRKAGLEMSEFNFEEKSGFRLKNFALNAKITDKELEISDLNIALNKSEISGFANVKYVSLSQLISLPENTRVEVGLPSFSIFLDELFTFQPALKQNQYVNKLSKKQLFGAVNVNGTLANLNISKTNVNWGSSTKIALNGNIKNSTKPDLLQLNIPNLKAETKRADLLQIVDEKQIGVRLPEKIVINGNIKGALNDLKADAKITTSQGFATVKGAFKNQEIIDYTIALAIENYNLGELLMNPKFGELSVTVNSKGSGKNINTLDATINTNIFKFQLENYAIKDLAINGDIKSGKGNITSNYKDENLNATLNAFVDLDSISTKANVNLNVTGADLQSLGLISRKVKTGMDISLDFKGNVKDFTIQAKVKDGVVIYDNRTYLVGLITAKALINKDTTAVAIKNKLINLNLESNTDPQTFSKAIQRHVWSYFYRDAKFSDTIVNPVNLKLKGKITQTELIKEVFLVNVRDLDTINFAIDFNEKERKLVANITAPHINYSGNKLDSFAFSMNTDQDDFKFNLGFKNITAGPLDVPKTVITGSQDNNELSLNFLGFHKGKKLMNINTKITGNRDELKLTVNSDSLILNKKKWLIPKDNQVVLTKDKLAFSNFKISKENQSIEITDQFSGVTKDHIAVEYQNFKISEFFSYLNPETEIAKGILNGNFILEQPFTETGIIADMSISELEFLKTNFGKLQINAKYLGGSKYDFNAKLNGGDVDLNLKGDYFVTNDNANLNLDLVINEFKMNALNTLSLGEIKETSGSFSGGFKVTGNISEPNYNGNLKFTNASFNVTKLNTQFTLQNEMLSVDNSGLQLSNFTVLDANKNSLVISGEINTKSFINPSFNLDVKANNFTVLNAEKEDNATLYGKASFDANAKLTGDLQIPKLSAELTVGSETDITYVVPSSYANVEERDGVVVFVNRENPDAILTKTEEQTAIITGIDLKAKLNINKEAAVTIVINEETGDNFKVSGEGDFIFTMIPNGRVTLTGVYEVSSGHYELNLYNLVDRKFSLAPGSRVSWSGDPLDAKLDVNAIYNLETSASPLMAAQISGKDASVANKFKQKLPFNVYLNIDGELLQPKISFNLDMPKEERGAIGGQVYGRVQQVNQQEDELNRQVFSLLVLNRFYPDAGSDGSSGGFATIARDNLNDAVSGQLNAFSDKILGGSGIELDFGLNSFTDYQGSAPTDRTQLDVAAQKKLFNDRFTVRVGSEIDIQGSDQTGKETPLIGNVSLEYKITEDGRYRLKGFRKSEFENVIDGQTIVSGISLIFTKEFNEFRQLWNSIFNTQKDKKEKEKEKVEREKSEEKNTENSKKKKN